MRTGATVLFVVLASLMAPACGGGGGDGTRTVMIEATAELTGYMASNGAFTQIGGTVLFIGDVNPGGMMPELGSRAFVSFDLSAIPPNAMLLSAVLRLTQTGVTGMPYTLGPLLVDQAVWGDVLEAGAYARTFPTNQGFAVLSMDGSLGVKSADVTVATQDDLASLRSRSQFRLRFLSETNSNSDGDQAVFAGPLAPEGPILEVKYRR